MSTHIKTRSDSSADLGVRCLFRAPRKSSYQKVLFAQQNYPERTKRSVTLARKAVLFCIKGQPRLTTLEKCCSCEGQSPVETAQQRFVLHREYCGNGFTKNVRPVGCLRGGCLPVGPPR